MCRSVVQRAVVWCCVLQCVAVCCSVVQRGVAWCSVVQYSAVINCYGAVATRCDKQRVAVCGCVAVRCSAVDEFDAGDSFSPKQSYCSVVQCSAGWCSVVQCSAV